MEGEHRGEQFFRVFAFDHPAAMLARQKLLFRGQVEHAQERIVVTVNVQQAARLGVQTKLGPGEDFAKLFEGAVPSRERNEAAGQLGHKRFAFVHGIHYSQFREGGVRQLPGHERFGNNTDYPPARGQHCIRDFAHQAHMPAPENKFDPRGGQRLAGAFRRESIVRFTAAV